jgi:hypothetical protein
MKVEAMLACEHVRDRDKGVPLARGMPSAAALGLGASLPQMVSPNLTVPLSTSQAAFQGALFAVVPLIVAGLLEIFAAGSDGGAPSRYLANMSWRRCSVDRWAVSSATIRSGMAKRYVPHCVTVINLLPSLNGSS